MLQSGIRSKAEIEGAELEANEKFEEMDEN